MHARSTARGAPPGVLSTEIGAMRETIQKIKKQTQRPAPVKRCIAERPRPSAHYDDVSASDSDAVQQQLGDLQASFAALTDVVRSELDSGRSASMGDDSATSRAHSLCQHSISELRKGVRELAGARARADDRVDVLRAELEQAQLETTHVRQQQKLMQQEVNRVSQQLVETQSILQTLLQQNTAPLATVQDLQRTHSQAVSELRGAVAEGALKIAALQQTTRDQHQLLSNLTEDKKQLQSRFETLQREAGVELRKQYEHQIHVLQQQHQHQQQILEQQLAELKQQMQQQMHELQTQCHEAQSQCAVLEKQHHLILTQQRQDAAARQQKHALKQQSQQQQRLAQSQEQQAKLAARLAKQEHRQQQHHQHALLQQQVQQLQQQQQQQQQQQHQQQQHQQQAFIQQLQQPVVQPTPPPQTVSPSDLQRNTEQILQHCRSVHKELETRVLHELQLLRQSHEQNEDAVATVAEQLSAANADLQRKIAALSQQVSFQKECTDRMVQAQSERDRVADERHLHVAHAINFLAVAADVSIPAPPTPHLSSLE